MSLSNSVLVGGAAGVAAGALVGVGIGRNIGAGTKDNPWPELLGIFGALAGGVLFATIANGISQANTTTTTTSNTVTNNNSSNGITTLPPAGA